MALSLPNNHLQTEKTQKRLDPPLSSLLQELREVGYSQRCVAIVNNADSRCRNQFKTHFLWSEEDIQLLHKSEPPFQKAFARRLIEVLFCYLHRNHEEQVNPLVFALTTVPTTDSQQSRDDGYLRKNSLQPMQAESSRGQRPKSAQSQLETSCKPPGPEPRSFSEVATKLRNEGQIPRCIAFDKASGRCKCRMDRNKLRRTIVQLHWFYSKENDEYRMPPEGSNTLRAIIHSWLCEHHSHWFWLDFYYELWSTDLGIDDESDESGQEESDESDQDESDESGQDESDESDGEETGGSVPNRSGATVEECSSPESDSAVAVEVSSDDEEISGSERGGFNSTSIIFNIAIQQNNYYGVSAEHPENQSANGAPGSQSTPQTANSAPNFAQAVLPASVLRLVPESQSSSPPVHTSTPSRSGSQQTTPSHETTPRLESLVADLGRLDLEDSPLASKRKSRVAKNNEGYIDSPFDVLANRFVRKLEKRLFKKLTARVTDTNKFRYIYVLTSTRFPGLVKIGRADDTEIRVKDIKRDCKLDDLSIEHVAEDVPYVKHVEKLIHWHLDPLNEIWDCEPEKTAHREWFRCKPDFAAEVVDTWAEWMREEPYSQEHGLLLHNQWGAKFYKELEQDRKGRKDEVFVDMFKRHKRLLEQL